VTSNWTAENIPDLGGKIAIVTGANSGIGYEVARALARKEATVILACRDKGRGKAAVRQIAQAYAEAKAELVQLDLSDLASIRRFAEEFTRHYASLPDTFKEG
jgi:NAD(P)-dependent dehydrogenase (short-subunit alcohol dehydrogenase family)